jgi:hypothetical protein
MSTSVRAAARAMTGFMLLRRPALHTLPQSVKIAIVGGVTRCAVRSVEQKSAQSMPITTLAKEVADIVAPRPEPAAGDLLIEEALQRL